MLHATPHGIFSWGFTVYQGDAVVADIDMSWLRERAEVQIGDGAYKVYRESVLEGTFLLQSGAEVLARAQKTSVFIRSFDVQLADRRLVLEALRVWSRQFGLFENGVEIGRIGPSGWFGWAADIDLPDDFPRPVQVFLFWLVLILWRRAANSS